MTEVLQEIDNTEEKKSKHIPIRLDRSLYTSVLMKMTPMGYKFQGLVVELLERWLSGEFEAKPEPRPISAADEREDSEILRVVHQPANRAEVLVSQTVKNYMEMVRKDRGE